MLSCQQASQFSVTMQTFYDMFQKPHELPEGQKVLWRISGYALVRSPKNEILMIKPGYGDTHWMLPGGGINPQESLAQGIERECLEESGYHVTVDTERQVFTGESNFYIDHAFFHSLNLVYEATLKDDHQEKVLDSYETEEVKWVPLEELNEENCHHIVYPAIQNLKKNHS